MSTITNAELMKEGSTRIYNSSIGINVVELISVSEKTNKAFFNLNNETASIKEDSRYIFDDGSEIYVRNILKNDDGKDLVEFFILFRTWKNITIVQKNLSKETTSAINQYNAAIINKSDNKTLGTSYPEKKEQNQIPDKNLNFFQKIIISIKNFFRAR